MYHWLFFYPCLIGSVVCLAGGLWVTCHFIEVVLDKYARTHDLVHEFSLFLRERRGKMGRGV